MVKRKYDAVSAADSTLCESQADNVGTYEIPAVGRRTGRKKETSSKRTSLQAFTNAVGASSASFELTKAEVKESCVALRLKQQRGKQGKRQYGRRSVSEPFKLSDSQKLIFANCYKSARNAERPVDYVSMSNTCHFNSFKGYPQLLAAKEGDIVRELQEALTEQRAIEARGRNKTPAELEEELARLHGLHKQQVARLKPHMMELEQNLANAHAAVANIRGLFCHEEKKNFECEAIKTTQAGIRNALRFGASIPFALEHEHLSVAELKTAIIQLQSQLISCKECGMAGDCVEQFTKRFALPARGKKQRDFTAREMGRIDAIKGAELMRDFDEFTIMRDDLWHERDGAKVGAIDHEYFQSLCRKIRDTVRYSGSRVVE